MMTKNIDTMKRVTAGAQLARGYPKAPAYFLNETSDSQAIAQHTLAQIAADATKGII